MTLTKAFITQMRLSHQQISAPMAGSAVEIVRWLGAVQAQDFSGAKWGLGLRLVGADDQAVEEAFNRGLILRTHLLRPTWHFVLPEDIRWLLALTAPRVRMAMQSTYRQLGITDELVQRANHCLETALRDGEPKTRDELRGALEQAGIRTGSGQVIGNLMMRAELDGLVCSGPRNGKQFTYMLLEKRVSPGKTLSHDEGLAELAGRFFLSRGPATPRDFAKWSGLTLGDARQGLESVKHQLIEEDEYWFPPGLQEAAPAGPTTHLMSIYDEYISGYQDHTAMVDPAFVDILSGLGNGLVKIIVVEGQVVGAWRREERKHVITIELNGFRAFQDAEMEAVHAAGHRYGVFFNKEVAFREWGGQ